MKNIQRTVLALSVALFTMAATAQTYKGSSSTSILDKLPSKAVELGYLSAQYLQVQNANLETLAQASNKVFVNQIGSFNEVAVNATSAVSDISLIQNGNSNDINLQVDATNIRQSVIQEGDNHSFIDVSPFTSKLHDLEILQRGRNQGLVFFGENSISQKLKVTMQGQGQTITLRNFN